MTCLEPRRWSAVRSIAMAVALVGLSAPAPAAEFTNTVCGYRVTYPDTWNAHMHANGRGLVLANFPWKKIRPGELYVPGGARIDIAMFPPYNAIIHQGDDDDTVLARLVGPHTKVIARTSGASGKPARITLAKELLGDRLVDTILHKGGKVFYVGLACGMDDPRCPGYEHVLDQVIASITLTGATPAAAPPTP